MSDSSSNPWSDNPNAPQIPHWLYVAEKTNIAGILIAGILYGTHNLRVYRIVLNWSVRLIVLGVVVTLFFQCMGTLIGSTTCSRQGTRWGLVAHATAMFSFVTIFTATNMDLLSISYIDNRAFPGNDMVPPGPFGYQFLVYSEPINVTPYIMFFLNNWLADGLLVSSTSDSVARPFNPGISRSYIAAALFTL
jgi:hypothetical protein